MFWSASNIDRVIRTIKLWRKRGQSNAEVSDGLADRPTNQDKLGYRKMARQLAKKIIEISRAETPLTIGVYGAWGSGKTSFLTMVSDELRLHGIAPVWFNAWRYDREENLWAALLQTILDKANISGGPWRRLTTRFRIWRDTIHLSQGLLSNTTALVWLARLIIALFLFALATLWQPQVQLLIMRLPEPMQLPATVSQVLLGVMAFIAAKPEQLLKLFDVKLNFDLRSFRREYSFRNHVAFLDQFHEEFRRIISIISPNKPLVIIIDDLDRCLPEKAIAVLEAMKQFLDASGCVFLVAIDNNIISNAVRSKYKDFSDTENKQTHENIVNILTSSYIEKIIQLPLMLPKIDASRSREYVTALLTTSELQSCSAIFTEGMSFNPRKVKRVIRVFAFLHDLFKNQHDHAKLSARLLAKLVLIQHEFSPVYDDILRRPSLLSILEQTCRGVSVSELGEPGLVEIAKTYLNRFELLRAILALNEGPEDSFSTIEIRDYIFALTAVTPSQPGDAKVSLEGSTSRDHLAANFKVSGYFDEKKYVAQYLREFEFQADKMAIFVEPRLRITKNAEIYHDSFASASRRSTRLLISGEPGSGKSVLLEWVVGICLESHVTGDFASQASHIGISEPVVPVLLKCLDYEQAADGLLALLARVMAQKGTQNISISDIQSLVESGRLFVVLDGLDEIGSQAREALATDLSQIAAQYPGIRCTVSSRFGDDERLLPGFLAATIEPFDEMQVSTFLRLATERLVQDRHEQERLLNAMLPRTKDLNGNPLLLSLTLHVARNLDDNPPSRAAFMAAAISFLAQREQRKSSSRKHAEFLEQILPSLALTLLKDLRVSMTKHELQRSIWDIVGKNKTKDYDGILDYIRVSPFMREIGVDKFVFVHRFVLHYFAAVGIIQSVLPTIEAVELLTDHPEILEYIVELDPQQCFQLIDTAVKRIDDDRKYLFFAVDAVISVNNRNINILELLQTKLNTLVTHQDLSGEVRSAAAALLERFVAFRQESKSDKDD